VADLLLIDEADQAYLRDSTKEYAAILTAARKYAGVTGTHFCLERGRTVPIYGPGKTFDKPCGLITKRNLCDQGHFHFIEPAPVAPSRRLKIDPKTKLDLSGDFDTQSTSDPMLSAIATDTKAVMDLLPPGQQFLFFGASTEQCDKQAAVYRISDLPRPLITMECSPQSKSKLWRVFALASCRDYVQSRKLIAGSIFLVSHLSS
jgi:hypothetical protein